MEVYRTLRPNQSGTKRYTREYGEKLVAVRYRKSTNPDNIYTTVEIIVDTRPYLPGITHVPILKDQKKQLVPIRIEYKEKELRQKIKSLGAQWNLKEKMWYLEYEKVCSLNLKDRIRKT